MKPVTWPSGLPLNLATHHLGFHCHFTLCYNFPFTFLPPWLNWKLLAIYFINCVCAQFLTQDQVAGTCLNEYASYLPTGCFDHVSPDEWRCSFGKLLGSWLFFINLWEFLIESRNKLLCQLCTIWIIFPTLWIAFSLVLVISFESSPVYHFFSFMDSTFMSSLRNLCFSPWSWRYSMIPQEALQF